MDKRYLTYADVEREYGIKVGTLYSLVARRAIPHKRLSARMVRFSREELERWFDERSVAGTETGTDTASA